MRWHEGYEGISFKWLEMDSMWNSCEIHIVTSPTSRSRTHPSLYICSPHGGHGWWPLPSLLFCSLDIWKTSHSPQVGRKSSFLMWWIVHWVWMPTALQASNITISLAVLWGKIASLLLHWTHKPALTKLPPAYTEKLDTIHSSGWITMFHRPGYGCVGGTWLLMWPMLSEPKWHIGSHFDEQQNEIGRTTEAATPRLANRICGFICQAAVADKHMQKCNGSIYSINSLIRSEARAKEAQRTNPPCCYMAPRFSSIAGGDWTSVDITHRWRIRQTKGAAKGSMIHKANEDRQSWKPVRNSRKLRPSEEKQII